MTGYLAPSPQAIRFALALAAERQLDWLGATGEDRVARVNRELESRELDKHDLSYLIDELKRAPFAEASAGLVPGVYRRNGTIYVVRQNRTNSRLHARRLVEIGGRRLTEANTVVRIEFEYDRDALLQLRPTDQMTLEEARPFIIRYGRCIFCNTPLKDATSVDQGVGPVCIKRYRPVEPPPQVSPETSDQLAELLARLKG